jgi:hypothetical protein
VVDEDPTGFLDQRKALVDVLAVLLRENALVSQSFSVRTRHAPPIYDLRVRRAS